ncbi:MAG: HEPN domain-containing protein [Thermomicrobium sp.]|nr:HEPN domain-containing protein [Thermomicrobium sp.]MDW7982902.1 HEPN domain-containing protein [Thermomicrobium sp.]
MNRGSDWLAQAARDLRHAEHAANVGDYYEWSCFAAQRAAEKAVKGVLLGLGGEGWGHSVLRLLERLATRMAVPESLFAAARRLDRHYIPARSPNGFPAGLPGEYYTAQDAEQAIADARAVVEFRQRAFPGS